MEEEKRRVTNYLRKAILAQVDKGIDFKNEEFYKISRESFKNGEIDFSITQKLLEENRKEKQKHAKKEEDEKNIDESIYVILAAKVIKTEVEGTQKKEEREDLTGIFFIPAILNKRTSSLLPAMEDNKLPWFPREILKPMIEPELAIGDGEIYDEVVSDQIYNLYHIVSWKDYIEYCKFVYESTTNCKFEEDEIYNMNGQKEKIVLDKNVYLFLDNTINPSFYIKKLYNNIRKQDDSLPLYEEFIALRESLDKPLLENTVQNRKKHCGQMGGQYGLSPSQRESLNHFNYIENGEMLAIKGPPGTGKTTLIQSVVASQYVKSAIEQKAPPLMVAASTNNQAVTNIIESFGKIVPKFTNHLETRWIEKVNTFAMYFPSKQKIKMAKQKGFQYTNNKGEYTLAEIDNEENIKKSKEKFLNEAEKLFQNEVEKRDITTYKEKIHKKLVELNTIQNNLIDMVKELEELLQQEEISDFIKRQEEGLKQIERQQEEMQQRVEFWIEKYKEIPKWWKVLAWIAKYKMKISNHLKIWANEKEEWEEEVINLETIETYYASKVQKNNLQKKTIMEKLERLSRWMKKYEEQLEDLKECDIDVEPIKQCMITKQDKLDLWLDTNVRYVSFWLAVHYYEARWLEEEYALTGKQKGTTYKNVLQNFYKRLSLITPCMVMTFYMLPRQFAIYGSEDGKEFLFNRIDTLIVDEAGQVSTEIGACSFALAKKAIVVGDEKQIAPVWAVEKPLDKSLAIQEKVISGINEFERLEKYGITASGSSIMKVACKASKYSKYGEKGLFLSEHRRCYDDIIQYCNELVYRGKLKPLRGNGKERQILPKMGYHLIESKKSKRVGTSRSNTIEAMKIARWILENEQKIFQAYPNIALDKVIGVITPFKEQAKEISNAFKQILPNHLKDRITVGTVHTFQGGERKIIILSTTYGREDGCFFMDHNKNMMNVAVSRAEDSFLVFGDVNCLKEEEKSPSGLLKKYILKEEV